MDRALADNLWHQVFPNANLHNLLPIGSDHAPILLVSDPTLAAVSRPFRVYESWFQHHTCKPLIQSTWHSNPSGSATLHLIRNLSTTTTALRKWKNETFGEADTHIRSLQQQLGVLHQAVVPDI